MNSLKRKNMIENYDGFRGDRTLAAVKNQIPAELLKQLTGKQLGLVMSAINAAYHAGKASTGAEAMDSDCVYVNSIGRVIEWKEVGAEFETVTEPKIFSEDHNPYTLMVTYAKKIKDGKLVCNFVGQ